MTSVAERLEPPETVSSGSCQARGDGPAHRPACPDAAAASRRPLRGGGLVGLLCDRDIAGNGVEVELFGERTTIPAGPAALALRTGPPLLAAVVYSGPGHDHTVVVRPPVDLTRTDRLRVDIARATQQVAREFETFIRRGQQGGHEKGDAGRGVELARLGLSPLCWALRLHPRAGGFTLFAHGEKT